MSPFRTILLLGALSTVFTQIAATEPSIDGRSDSVGDGSIPFQELLKSVPEDNLHAALHEAFPSKYKHGVFQEDRTALEALHRDNADVAISVVELAKRQSNSTARLSSSNRASSTPASNPSTTTRAGQTSTAAASSQGPSSQAPTSGFQTGSLIAGGVITTTDASGNTGVSTLSAGSVLTSTDPAGSVVTITVDPTPSPSSTAAAEKSSGSITSTVLQTTTLSNGARSTVTAVTVVGGSGGASGETPSGTAGAPSTSTTTGSSGLQAGSAVSKMGKEVLAMVGGAMLFAMAIQY